jgi:hypothetical protein
MSAAKKVDLMRPMKVSARDQAIYEAVVIGGKTQRSMALEHKLSPPRVSAILKRVTRWLSQGAPPGLEEIYRRDRLRVVSRVHRLRLDQLYREAVEAWHKSDQTTHSLKEKVVKGEVVSQERQVHTQLRDRRYLQDICHIVDRIAGFEGFDKQGYVDESCAGRVYEEPERTPVDSYREVKRRTILGGFDTPGDEGIPGMWEEEMVRRNAEVGGRRKVEGRMQKEESRSNEGESQSERQLGASSLAPVLRGEGRGEGPALRADPASQEASPTKSEEPAKNSLNTSPAVPAIFPTAPQHFCDKTANNPTQSLTKKLAVLAQGSPPPAVTTSAAAEKSLTLPPPKVPRFRLMGTAAEMAESLGYDDFFSPAGRLARAFAAANAGERRAQDPPLTPEYRGEPVSRR